jgi:hypothetical protein
MIASQSIDLEGKDERIVCVALMGRTVLRKLGGISNHFYNHFSLYKMVMNHYALITGNRSIARIHLRQHPACMLIILESLFKL